MRVKLSLNHRQSGGTKFYFITNSVISARFYGYRMTHVTHRYP